MAPARRILLGVSCCVVAAGMLALYYPQRPISKAKSQPLNAPAVTEDERIIRIASDAAVDSNGRDIPEKDLSKYTIRKIKPGVFRVTGIYYTIYTTSALGPRGTVHYPGFGTRSLPPDFPFSRVGNPKLPGNLAWLQVAYATYWTVDVTRQGGTFHGERKSKHSVELMPS